MAGPSIALVVDGPTAVLARPGGRVDEVATAALPRLVASLEAERPRWVWWSAARHAPLLVAAGLQLSACWDLAAVHRLLVGGRRDDEAAVVATAAGQPPPPLPDDRLTLLHRDGSARGSDRSPTDRALLALEIADAQAARLAVAVDPRVQPTPLPLQLATAHAESAAALLAVELEHGGLPFSTEIARAFLQHAIGAPGSTPAARDAAVLEHFPGTTDLRNALKVRDWLAHNGFDLPDTRSWRLEPFAATSPGIAALLAWRKAERIATTYGYDWLTAHVREGRLRGQWAASDGAGGRMTASAGLHNLPAELRGCVVADPGHVFVRADLGQIEPRVLAVVSGDPGFTAATQDADLYAPVAAALAVDRPTAKVAVLAAMYGQTTGPAGAALARMERTYPRAMGYLRAAEDRGQAGLDVRTWGGRTVQLGGAVMTLPEGPTAADRSRGRFARNAVVQGAAAEFFKAWAATVRAGLPAYSAQIVLCLHDELLVHAPAEHAAAVEDLLHRAVAATASWWATGSGVRFVAVTSVARSWAEAKD